MATRYGRGFGLSIPYVPKYVEEPDNLLQLMNGDLHVPVLVDCVDNNKTRLMMKEAYERYAGTAIMLSSGNEESAGQVLFSYRNASPGRPGTGVKVESPSFLEVFPNTPMDKLPTELSCAEASESAPQNIHTNMTAANILFGFANKLLNGEPIDELLVFFDTTSQQNKTHFASEGFVKDMLTLVKGNASYKKYISVDVPYKKEEEITVPTLNSLEEVAV